MIDATSAFARQFEPVDGGYVYYPSRKAGGKLVTTQEYESLVADWERVVGVGGCWKTAGFVFGAILLWRLVSQAVALPDWADGGLIAACVATVSGRLFWASMAPRRLVKNRPDIAPRRAGSEARREARAALKWPFVFFVLLFSGAVFLWNVSSPHGTLAWWLWVLGSGLFFVLYLWIAFQKLRDRPS